MLEGLKRKRQRRALRKAAYGSPSRKLMINLSRNVKGYVAKRSLALAKKLAPLPMKDLEVYVRILYADGSYSGLVENITLSQEASITKQTETIFGTVRHLAKIVIEELPRQKRRKIKGCVVILKDLQSSEETILAIALNSRGQLSLEPWKQILWT